MILIGEKLNGSIPAVAQAIAARNDSLIRERALMQAAAEADYLDLCAATEVSAEPETLRWLIEAVEAVTDVPLCLDSPNPRALADAMKLCARPGLLNSVSLEGDKARILFPAIAGTGWGCIALLCDDSGIPDSTAKRLAVFDELMRRAEGEGVPPEKLFIDPLVISFATDEDAPSIFFECVRAIRARDPRVHITSGLSNVSFGLPARKYINQAFLALAMQAGMDSAILDPANRDLMGLLQALTAMLDTDEGCLSYIGAFRRGLFGENRH